MSSPEHHLINRLTGHWIGLVLFSGIALLGVLPFGMLDILHPFIPFFSIAHAGALVLAATVGLVYLRYLAGGCRWPMILTWCALSVPAAALFILGPLPISDTTALSNYLALPKWWIDSGAIVPFLWFAPSLKPNLVGLAFVELLNNDLAQCIPLYLTLYLIAVATLTARLVEHRTHRKESACLAFLFTLTVPIALRSATVPWPNLPAALFIGVAIALLIGWLDDERRRYLPMFAGIALGLAGACASSSFVALLATLPALLGAARSKGIGWWGGIKSCVLVVFFAFLAFSPWLVKNALWVANPFHPLAGNLLGSNSLIAGSSGSIDIFGSLVTVGERWQETILSPFIIAFFSHDGSNGRYDGVASPLFALALVPLWSYRKHPSIIFLGLFLILFFLGAAVEQLSELRDFLPLLVPVSALTILGIGGVGSRFKRRYERAAVGFLIAAQVVSCAVYVVERAYRLGALSPRIDDATYLRQQLSDYRMVERINSEVPRTEYVYDLLAITSLFYLSPRVITGGVERTAQIEQWLRSASSPHILANEFLNRGIRFVVLDTARLASVLNERVTTHEAKLWDQFVGAHLTELAVIDTRHLCRIKSDRTNSSRP